jgi:hypothetical protein
VGALSFDTARRVQHNIKHKKQNNIFFSVFKFKELSFLAYCLKVKSFVLDCKRECWQTLLSCCRAVFYEVTSGSKSFSYKKLVAMN